MIYYFISTSTIFVFSEINSADVQKIVKDVYEKRKMEISEVFFILVYAERLERKSFTIAKLLKPSMSMGLYANYI